MNTNQASLAIGRHEVTINVAATTTLAPQQVLESAHDFSPRRAGVWPNVRSNRIVVHARGENFAEVTEGTWVVGLFWERNRYEWSGSGSVKATVIDSNIFEPGSTWEIRATARDRGSDVELLLHRGFRRGPKGAIAGAVHRSVGRWVWGLFLRRALAAAEKQVAARPGGSAAR